MKSNISIVSDGIPHSKWLGVQFDEIGHGFACGKLPFDEKLVGNIENHNIASGAVIGFIDQLAGAAAMSATTELTGLATLDLRIDYLRPLNNGKSLEARAECYHITKDVAFIRASAWEENDENRKIASVQGTFMLIKEHSKLARVNRPKDEKKVENES